MRSLASLFYMASGMAFVIGHYFLWRSVSPEISVPFILSAIFLILVAIYMWISYDSK